MSKGKKKPKEKKPERVTCSDCGMEYDKGAPHQAFCRGFKGDSNCDECGLPAGDDGFKCAECGAISCAVCGDVDDKLCAVCKTD